MKVALPLLTLLLIFTLTACEKTPQPDDTVVVDDTPTVVDDSGTTDNEPVIRETHNVSYSGKVQPAGISIYMEGTHRLSLTDGRFILLESSKVDLNGYVGEYAEVIGSIRPTVESDSMIMRVESIKFLEGGAVEADQRNDAANQESSDEEENDAVEQSSSLPAGQVGAPELQSPSQESVIEDDKDDDEQEEDEEQETTPSDTPDSPDTPTSPQSELAPMSAAARAAAEVMAEHKFGSDQWTQTYCSSHVGFCVPVHRNWWYKSFGPEGDSFWHVEMKGSEIENLGEGGLTVDFFIGRLSDMGISDKTVTQAGDYSIGYRSWFDDNRHFVIRAPSALQAAVEYITNGLIPTGD